MSPGLEECPAFLVVGGADAERGVGRRHLRGIYVGQVAAILDGLGIPYALGGSMASSLIGEPRSTVDVDIAIRVAEGTEVVLLERANAEFYVPMDSARAAIRAHSSFNLVDTAHGLKVDLFVLGDGLLDRMQIERRLNVSIPGFGDCIWVTSPEDQILRKLDWYRDTSLKSERQWRDVVGILRIQGDALDRTYLDETACRSDIRRKVQFRVIERSA